MVTCNVLLSLVSRSVRLRCTAFVTLTLLLERVLPEKADRPRSAVKALSIERFLLRCVVLPLMNEM